MTDRELLELAARAADVDAHWRPNVATGGEWLAVADDSGWIEWNPLTDDGDALRLAVKLGMYVECNRGDTEVRCAPNDGDFYITERFNGDAASATRRAIVRAAAAIGEKL